MKLNLPYYFYSGELNRNKLLILKTFIKILSLFFSKELNYVYGKKRYIQNKNNESFVGFSL